jgi:hypothetical protein
MGALMGKFAKTSSDKQFQDQVRGMLQPGTSTLFYGNPSATIGRGADMTDPVFVIHGVGNRDRSGFEERVARLQDATGGSWDMKAVYWGDLGADDRWVSLTIPSADEPGAQAPGFNEVRDGYDPQTQRPGQWADILAAALLAPIQPATPAEVREAPDELPVELAAAAAVKSLETGSARNDEVREEGEIDPAQAADVRNAITEHWASTNWLCQVADPLLLQEIGAAIAAPLTDPSVTTTPRGGEEVRDQELRAIDVRGFVKRRIDDLDRVVGATVAAAAGRLNSYLRTEQGPGVTRFFGDVLVYQRHRREIQERVRATIDEVNPALGRDSEHAVRVIGHSLGGVIAVDIATADKPLWIRSLVTFGSQSPFFHVCDPRGGQLRPYADGTLVQLPPSLDAWTNLWEPLDVLAFIAAKVFRMHDGSTPIDLPISHLASSGLWTHSAYWDLSQVAAAIKQALERDGS